MRIQYGTNKGKNYTEEEDRFLVFITNIVLLLPTLSCFSCSTAFTISNIFAIIGNFGYNLWRFQELRFLCRKKDDSPHCEFSLRSLDVSLAFDISNCLL